MANEGGEKGAAATRRRVLLAGGAAAGWAAAGVATVRPAGATPGDMAAAIGELAGGAEVRPGRVTLDIPPLVENGNSVPVAVAVESPMTEGDHVRSIAIFNERNPQPQVARFHLGPRAGRAAVATRMRLATSQKVVAVAELSDGTFRSGEADVIVTLAACVES